jgi:hypothetical protein
MQVVQWLDFRVFSDKDVKIVRCLGSPINWAIASPMSEELDKQYLFYIGLQYL